MPAVFTPTTDWSDNRPIATTWLQALFGTNGNLDYLLNGRAVAEVLLVAGADYTKTGVGSDVFADVDATNLILTLTPQSSRILLEAQFVAGVSAGSMTFDFLNTVSGSVVGGTNGLIKNALSTATAYAMGKLVTGLTPGTSYSFKLQWKQSATANTITLKNNGFPIHLVAREV